MASRGGSEGRRPDTPERLRGRYPRSRLPRPVLTGLVGAGVLLALGWLVWAAYVHATPAVAGQVAAYSIPDDHTMSVTLTVQRRRPATPASCRIVAQATDFQTVGEQQVRIPAGPYRLTDVNVTLTTLRRATAALVKSCVVAG